MATRAKQQYYGDGSNIVKNSRTFELSQEILDKIDSAGGEGAISTIKVNGVVQPITNKTVNIGVPVVEDNLNSYSTANALSANQGRLLYDEIQKFQTIGHFLSLWDATTGKPVTDPTTLPYIYNTGDYFIVSKVGTTNYRPDGTEYTGAASQVAESETVTVDDFYFFNGTNWFHLKNEGAGIAIDSALSTTSTNPVENRAVTEAINQKASLDNLQTLQDQIDEKADAGDIPTVNDATLTIQKNGTDQGTFSANQATDATINLTVNKIDVGLSNVDNTSDADKPISTATQTALDGLSDRIDALEDGDITDIKDDITDLQDNKADKTDLGDATLTVQKNGTAVGTFTANSKTDTTINLELTKSDVGLGNVDNTADVDKPISTATQEALDAKADKSDTYTKTETDAKIDEKLGDTVNDATITITQGGTTKGTFTLNQAGDATIALDAGSEDGMQYPDFAFVNKTGNDITLDISSKVANPSADFTINAPGEIKDGITYVLRVENGATPPAMTLGTNITNPYNVDLTLSASKTDTFAFLAVDGKLEMQPTEADVPENVYTKEEVNQMVAGKMDTPTGGTAGQVLTKTASGSEWADAGTGDGDIKYEDFEFVAMTGTVIENLSATKSISADTTLTAGTSLKEGMQYLVDVTNTDTAKHTVTFGSESVEIEAGESKKLVFLATSSSTLELQKSNSGGGGDLSNYYTKTETNTLLDDKVDKSELQLIYDAIVAADGSGDYTTIGAAIDDGKRRIFVQPGTYNETSEHQFALGNNESLIIHGAGLGQTVLNYSVGESTLSRPGFLNLTVTTPTYGNIEIGGLTVNATCTDSGNYSYYCFLEVKESGARYMVENINIHDIIFNIKGQANRLYFYPYYANASTAGTAEIYNCTFLVDAETTSSRTTIYNYDEYFEGVEYRNCSFNTAGAPGQLYLGLNNLFDCKIVNDGPFNLTSFSAAIDRAENCIFSFPQEDCRTPITLSGLRNCSVRYDYTKRDRDIPTNTIIPKWAANTSYSVGNYVIYGESLFVCTTAHTSSEHFYDDEDNWEIKTWMKISNCSNCDFTLRAIDKSVSGICVGNNFDGSSTHTEDFTLFSRNCKVDNNIFPRGNYYISRGTLTNNTFSHDGYGTSTYIDYDSNGCIIITGNQTWQTNMIRKQGTGTNAIVANNGAIDATN